MVARDASFAPPREVAADVELDVAIPFQGWVAHKPVVIFKEADVAWLSLKLDTAVGKKRRPRAPQPWKPATYRGILLAFAELAAKKSNNRQVRLFVERYGFFDLDDAGRPRWHRGVLSPARTSLPQQVEWYHRLARFVDGTLEIATSESQSIAATVLLDVVDTLISWGDHHDQLFEAYADGPKATYAPIFHAAELARVLRERITVAAQTWRGHILVSGPHGQPDLLHGLALVACNAWIGAGRISPYAAPGPHGHVQVYWNGGPWGAIGAQLVAAIARRGHRVRCANPECNRLIRTKRRPQLGRLSWCGRPGCRKYRNREEKHRSREKQQRGLLADPSPSA